MVLDPTQHPDWEIAQDAETRMKPIGTVAQEFGLLPEEVLAASVRRYFRRKQIPVYGDCVFPPKVKPALQKMSEELGVSYTAMLIQLRKYGLLEDREMSQYFSLIVKDGDGYE